ncbi:hypothetical protein PENTCL1PPCAC_10266, partial [Pristionchus entomophagus]
EMKFTCELPNCGLNARNLRAVEETNNEAGRSSKICEHDLKFSHLITERGKMKHSSPPSPLSLLLNRPADAVPFF